MYIFAIETRPQLEVCYTQARRAVCSRTLNMGRHCPSPLGLLKPLICPDFSAYRVQHPISFHFLNSTSSSRCHFVPFSASMQYLLLTNLQSSHGLFQCSHPCCASTAGRHTRFHTPCFSNQCSCGCVYHGLGGYLHFLWCASVHKTQDYASSWTR